MPKFDLSDEVEDIITGFHGVVVGIAVWLNGCKRIGIQSPSLGKDGVPLEIVWFDDTQCKLIRSKDEPPHITDGIQDAKGGPMPEPTRNQDP